MRRLRVECPNPYVVCFNKSGFSFLNRAIYPSLYIYIYIYIYIYLTCCNHSVHC
jgi:hypothetical protein